MFNAFYNNPRLLILTVGLILVGGLSAFRTLARMEDPELTSRNAVVQTRYPGATAERVEALVTEVIEEALSEFGEIRKLTSDSRAGISTIMIELNDDVTQISEVWSRMRDELGDIAAQLPEGAEEPEFEELDITAFTIIIGLSWDLETKPNPAILRRTAQMLRDRLRSVPRTRDVEIFGDQREEILVEVDAARLASLGLTVADVSRKIRQSDSKVSAGQVRGNRTDLLIEVRGELDSLDRIKQILIQSGKDGRFVRLSDIGSVRKAVVDPPAQAALFSGRPGVAVALRMQSGERVDLWASRARAAIDAFESELPRGLGLQVIFDQSSYTQSRLDGLFANMLLGAVLVMTVVLLAMGWRSALIVGVALPLTIMMVLGGMRLLGIPLHQMSVTGLIIALGLLIDNAIVMVDEVRHRMREEQDPARAVGAAVRGLFVPLMGSTLTTILAFMPIVLMPGATGEFVGAMAASVMLALVSSFFLAMLVTPTLAGLLGPSRGGGWLDSGVSSARLTDLYRRLLAFLFERPLRGVAVALLFPAIGFALGAQLQEQFFPASERDHFQIEIELPQQASIKQTLRIIEQAHRVLKRHRSVVDTHWFAGASAPKFYYNMVGGREQASFYAHGLVQLRSAKGATQVIQELQTQLDAQFPSARVLARQLEQGPPFEAPVELHISGPDLQVLGKLGDRIRREMARVPGVVHSRPLLVGGRAKLWVTLDEQEVRRAGLDNRAVARRLQSSLEGSLGGSLIETTEELPVRVRLSSATRADVDKVATLELMTSADRWTTLAALGEVELRPQWSTIRHRNGIRTNTVQAFLVTGTLPNQVLEQLQQRLRGLDIPPGYRIEVGGESAERNRAMGSLGASVVVLLLLMVATLVLSFNSFRLAAIVGAVAFASVGLSGLALSLFGYPFGFMAIVGTMGLVGVAINDAIVVLAALRRADATNKAQVTEVVVESTRHVLATTITTMAGFAPLIISGGSFWPPVAVAIAGGIAGATILALTFVPATYLLLQADSSRTLAALSEGEIVY